MTARRVLLVGGGTAGSVTPLLAVAEHIGRIHPETEFLFLGTARGPEQSLAESAGLRFRPIPAGKLRRYWSWKNFTDIFQIWRGYRAARAILRDWRPDAMFSAGSFAAVPVAWAAKNMKCRIVIHQQDVRPGLANRLMAKTADIITVSFLTSLKDFSHPRVILTGNPVRPAILHGSLDEARRLFELEPNLPTLLVLGGGTGSHAINTMISGIMHRLVEEAQVIHLTGPERDWPELHHRRYHRYNFLTWQIPHALQAADLVVCRAGLGTMTELAAVGKAAVFIPMPQTHQEDNTALIKEINGGLVLSQTDATNDSLLSTLTTLLRDPATRAVYAGNIHQMYRPDAVAHIAALVLEGERP